jgi:hypothetical protein
MIICLRSQNPFDLSMCRTMGCCTQTSNWGISREFAMHACEPQVVEAVALPRRVRPGYEPYRMTAKPKYQQHSCRAMTQGLDSVVLGHGVTAQSSLNES